MSATDEREACVRELLPLVRRIARRISRLVPSVDIDDLIGDGSIGLLRAVDNFDETRGPSREQYARRLIAGAMLNGVRRMDPVSERARRAMREGEAERFRLAVELGELPSPQDVDSRCPGYLRATVVAYRAQPLSLDAPLPEGESLSGDWGADPARLMEGREETATVRRLLEMLPERQRSVIVHHYFKNSSLREIGSKMSISPQRASQLHLAAMARLKKYAHVDPR